MLPKTSGIVRKKLYLKAPFFWLANGKIVISRKNCDNLSLTLPKLDSPENSPKIILSESNPYIHECLYVQQCQLRGRGIFSEAELPSGKEIMRIPALVSYGGEEPDSELIIKCACQFLDTLSRNCPTNKASEKKSYEELFANILKYVDERVLTLLTRNWRPFSPDSEKSIVRDRCKALYSLFSKLDKGFSPNEIADVFGFNRFDAKRQHKKYCAVFPEASLFNHDCVPNVEIEIITPSSYSVEGPSPSSTCVLIARTCRKVVSSEELYISYFEDKKLNLVQKGKYMKQRWRFECVCKECRVRLVKATFLIFIVASVLAYYFVMKYVVRR